VTKTGGGDGTVSSSPTGITCGTTCSAIYPAGTVVTMTATPAAGSTFKRWSGACAGTASSCTVTINAARTVTANFGGLVGNWKLDRGTGLVAADSSGHGLAGTLVNGPLWQPGRSGSSLALDGVNDFVRVPHAALLDAFPLTITAWVNTTSSSGLKGLVNKYAAGSFNGYQVFFQDGTLCAWLFRDAANAIYDGGECTMRTAGFNDGRWHHVAFVADAAGGKLYVDSVLRASQPWTGAAGAPTTIQEVHLGHYPGVTGGASYVGGGIDEVRIYDRALTAAQVVQVYNAVP
jgi:hypothetical protein